jgi:hypothetical protein
MNISPWTVASWPDVEWYLPLRAVAWPRFKVGGIGIDDATPSAAATGSTVWVADVRGADVGLSWDWVEVRPNVVAFRDPNGIVSNLRLLRDEDHYEPPLTAALSLMRLASRLPWQARVVGALQAARAPAANSPFPSPHIGGGRAQMTTTTFVGAAAA